MSVTRTAMSSQELVRAREMGFVADGTRKLKEAAIVLGLSYRQTKRIYKRYREEGDEGIAHRSLGGSSGRAKELSFRRQVVQTYAEQYQGFGPTFAAEKLSERDGLEVNSETLRRWLIAEDLWHRKRRAQAYRSRRERRHRFGELVQFDGSHHKWFEGRAERCCLMNMVDDATGTTMGFLDKQETTEAAFKLLWDWICRYGIPQALYCDRKNAFVIDREPTVEEQLRGETPRSHFQRACEKLGIELIVARSPQAKGRVERSHAVYQDRFVKELKLKQISNIEEANYLLESQYLPEINAKFAKAPIDSSDAHVALLATQSLEDILCFEYRRKVSEDYVVLFENGVYQLKRHKRIPLPRPGSSLTVRKWLDGSVHFYSSNGQELTTEQLPTRPKKKEAVRHSPVPVGTV